VSGTQLRHGEQVLDVQLAVDGARAHGTVGDRAVDAQRLASTLPAYATAGATVQEVVFIREGRTRRAIVVRHRDRVLVALEGRTYAFAAGDAARDAAGAAGGTGKIAAPMPGKVIAVLVQVGDRVEHGQPVVVVEAMKMETTLTADVDGEVARIGTAVGEKIDAGALLVEITPAASSA
jgi:3-methylcrotonyl-CoA carboxylase alpha subunit